MSPRHHLGFACYQLALKLTPQIAVAIHMQVEQATAAGVQAGIDYMTAQITVDNAQQAANAWQQAVARRAARQ